MPLMPAIRIISIVAKFGLLLWHIDENLETKKSYRLWYDGVSSSMLENRTNYKQSFLFIIYFIYIKVVNN